jgi:Pro-kumamolisin, activation domain/Subtilase family
MRLSRSVAAFILSLLALCCAAPAGAAGAGVRIGEAPELPAGATFSGAVAPERELDLSVALEPRDPAALEAFAEEVATPGSPSYGDYLSVPAFAARFAPTPAQLATVRAALAARGLRVGAPAANDLSLPVTATAAAAEAAFGTAIDRVRTPSGRVAFANRTAPQLPAAAAPFVQGVLGLDDLQESHRGAAPAAEEPAAPGGGALDLAPASTSVATGGPQPCTEARAAAEVGHGYTADQIATAYGLSGFYAAGDFGAGQTVALLELEPFLPADIETFQACYGTQVEVDTETIGKGPGPYAGEDGEAALDIEQLIGLAPGARIVVYQAKNEGDNEAKILSAYVSQDIAKVMSSSWGICEEEADETSMAAVGTLLEEAAAQGQSFFVAAGDWGSTDCYEPEGGDLDQSLQVDFPGSDPFATDVGGTRMVEPTAPTPTDYLWDEAPKWGAGGGGISEHFAMPAYQQDAAPSLGVVGALSSGAPCGLSSGYCREVPDVSANASLQTGYVIRAEEEWEVTGGTSAAAPFWAALATLTDASPACGGNAIGFANPALYKIGASAYAADFRDVTGPRPGGKPTTNRLDDEKPFPARPGYDMASGIGTPVGTALAASLCALAHPVTAPPGTPTSTPPTPSPPTPTRVLHAHLAGVAKGKPRLTLSLTAREGADLTTLSVGLPPALRVAARPRRLTAGIAVRDETGRRLRFKATSTPGTIRIHLRSPRPNVRLRIGFPALATTPKLAAHIREGRTHKLGLVVTTRESGAKGARFPLTVPL